MRNFGTTGLSLSQAQSISNLCFQRAQEITNTITNVNNASVSITIGNETYEEIEARPLPENVVELLKEKAKLHSTQAFLMSAIKEKDAEIKRIQKDQFVYSVPTPQSPTLSVAEVIPTVNEEWVWSTLSDAEYNEYLEAEAYAAHIGQFIHKDGTLDSLRKELPQIKGVKWMEIETGKKTPLKVVKHHTSTDLLQLHETLASLHKEKEQRVNYFKAKVKNLVTEKNAEIAQANAIASNQVHSSNNKLRDEYSVLLAQWSEKYKEELQIFEKNRAEAIKKIVNLRIIVDPRFQDTINKFQVKE